MIATVKIFICAGTMEALFYNQTTLFYNQIVSPVDLPKVFFQAAWKESILLLEGTPEGL